MYRGCWWEDEKERDRRVYGGIVILKLVFMIITGVVTAQTGWTVWGSNPGGGEIFHTRLDRPWGPPSLLHNGYRVLPTTT